MPTFNGTNGNDTITGSAFDDIINGLGGDDILNGHDGDDVIDPGTGADTVDGGAGDDRVIIDRQDVTGAWVGGDGIDTLDGSGSTFGLVLAAATDGTSDGLVVVQSNLQTRSFERYLGSAFNDSFAFQGAAFSFTVLAGAGNDLINGGHGNDVMNGGDGDDVINLLNGNDTALGGNGNDSIGINGPVNASEFGTNHVIDGGAGVDTFRHAGLSAVIDLQAGTASVGNGSATASTFSLVNVENVRWSGFGTVIARGDGNGNFLQTNEASSLSGGAVTLDGRGGNDVLWASIRNDALMGGDGNDQLFGLAGNDSLAGGDGDDLLHGGFYTANAAGRTGDADSIDGGEGNDTVSYADQSFAVGITFASYAVTLHLGTGTATSDGETDTLTSIENAIGSRFADIMIGSDGANALYGGAGDDRLDGGLGADLMEGGSGNDLYTVDNAGDRVVELAGGGVDRVNTSVSFNASGQDIETVVITGSANANVAGNDLDNTLLGNSANNYLNGGRGADRMNGGLGNDTYGVENVGDVVLEATNAGADYVRAAITYKLGSNVENLTLVGSQQINAIGNELGNVLVGNARGNVIVGLGGRDLMTGGGGADRFDFDSVSDSPFAAYDRITDLETQDVIDLSSIDADTVVAGNQAFVLVDAFTGQAGQLSLTYNVGGGFTVLAADVNGDGQADLRIILDGNHEAYDNFRF